jgi:hypothetical protein
VGRKGPVSPEVRERISESNRTFWQSPAGKEKMRRMRDKSRSPEARQRKSEAMKKAWENDPRRLPPMTKEQRRVYTRLVSNMMPRAEALAIALRPPAPRSAAEEIVFQYYEDNDARGRGSRLIEQIKNAINAAVVKERSSIIDELNRRSDELIAKRDELDPQEEKARRMRLEDRAREVRSVAGFVQSRRW